MKRYQLMLGYTGALRTDFTEVTTTPKLFPSRARSASWPWTGAGVRRGAEGLVQARGYQTGTISDRSGSSPYFS